MFHFYKLSILTLLLSLILLSNGTLLAQNAASISDYYDEMPDIANCKAGKLKAAEKQKVLDKVNYIRSLHGLKPVEYKSSDDFQTTAAALIVLANHALSHTPTSSFQCYSQDGYDGASKSNLFLFMGSDASMCPPTEISVRSWLVDSLVNPLGHRRAILNPFLKYISFGRVDGKPKVDNQVPYAAGMALKVYFDDEQDVTDWTSDFVAYPQGNYPPAFFSKKWFMSFTAVPDKSALWNNASVNYASATVEIKDESDNKIKIDSLQFDNLGAGVPNNIKWIANGLKDETKYFVTIKNVLAGGNKKDYSYWFKLTNAPADPPQPPTLASPVNNADSADINITLKWNAVQDADSYHLQVAKNNTFTQPFDKKGLTTSSFDTTGLQESTRYYWRVSAINKAGESAWSPVWSFKTRILVPSVPVEVYPPDKEKDVTMKPAFRWNKNPKAATYHLQVADNPFSSQSTIIDRQDIADTSYTDATAKFKPLTTYYWRVRGKNAGGFSPWSAAFSFITESGQSVGDIAYTDNNVLNNFPNPVRDNTTITYKIEKAGNIRLSLFNSMGGEILRISEGWHAPGVYSLNFSPDGLPSGIYYCRLKGNALDYIRIIEVLSR